MKPEIEARLLAQAKAQSVSVEHLLEIQIEGCLFSLQPEQQSAPKDRLAVLKALGKSPSLAQASSLSEDAIARESIYRERENAQL